MTDTMRDAFRSGIAKLRYLPHEMAVNPITGNYDDPRVYADYLVWQAAQAYARVLVGEMIKYTNHTYHCPATISFENDCTCKLHECEEKAQAFMEGK